ncbi:flagellin [Niallia alba]|uniref:flagellin N-terminal helical domain-containing protein n=1 Tax=Niallia alba TaxID=2729105 RepID=UPI002E241B94|nr:flagellin [Niallia alba]
MRINHNIAALNTYNKLNSATNAQSKSMEKLSSGLRINSAADDAAGLAISEKMRGQIRGLDQAAKNAQDGISLIQTAEGALSETTDILQRMRELATQASNDTNTETDRGEIQKEMNSLTSEINRIGNTTEFNTQSLLNGSKDTTTKEVKAGDVLTEAKAASVTVGDLTFTAKTEGADANKYSVEIVQADGEDIANAVEVADNKITITIGTTGTTPNTVSASDIKDLIEAKTDVNDLVEVEIATGKEAENQSLATAKNLAGGVTEVKATENDVAAAGKGLQFQIGANENQSMTLEISDMRAKALGLTGSGEGFTSSTDVSNGTDSEGVESGLDVSNAVNASKAITTIQKAIDNVSAERSKLGANQNRLDHTINNLSTSSENLTAAESRIRDVDYALAA